jgi:hypothetical protein
MTKVDEKELLIENDLLANMNSNIEVYVINVINTSYVGIYTYCNVNKNLGKLITLAIFPKLPKKWRFFRKQCYALHF